MYLSSSSPDIIMPKFQRPTTIPGQKSALFLTIFNRPIAVK